MSEFSTPYQPQCRQHTFQTVTCSRGARHLHTELYILLELWPETFRNQLNANLLPQICLECSSISLGKQVSFSGQCENKENTLQSQDCFIRLPLHAFLIFRKSMSVCGSSLSTSFWFSGELKSKKQKLPHLHCRSTTLIYCPRERLSQLLLSCHHQIVCFLLCRPQK